MATMEFLSEIPMNKRSMLDQSLGRFQSVRFGLPELVKNSKDHYSRLGILDPTERVIVVLASSDERRLGVLDFGGANSEDFKAWQTWADPDANRGGSAHDIEGGHGNGGKGFMVRGATEDSSFESCRDGLRTKMGFSNVSERQYFPGYFTENGAPVDNKKVKNVQVLLEHALEQFGAKLDSLPELARAAFGKRKAFSLIQLNSVKDWAGRRSVVRHQIANVPSELLAHPQAALTIETCSVFFIIDGKLHSKTPLVRTELAPLPGFEDLPPIPIPSQLPDPHTGVMVSTGAPSALAENAAVNERRLAGLEHGLQSLKHQLHLKTSAKLLRGPGGKQLNVVRVRNAKNVVGNWSIADLQPQPSSGYIYGTLAALNLGPEHQVGADRVDLADVPLVRALEVWTAAQIGELASKIQKALAKEQKPEEVEKANDGLRQMREAMRQFLADLTKGRGGRGTEDGDVGPPAPPTRGTVVRQLVLEGGAQSIALAKGTTVPLLVKGYDVSESGQKLLVPNPNLELHSDPPNLVALDGKRVLRAENAGRTTIWFRDASSGTESNHVEVEVITATGAEIREIPSRLLLQGETVPLRVSFHTARGTRKDLLVDARADLLVDAEVDEPLMGRVDRYGAFTAGAHEGSATVRVRYGAAANETVVAVLHVGPDKIPPKPRTGADRGPDVPVILLCGQEAPNMEQFPMDQRTFPPSEQAPTIIDYEPTFAPATIFINHQSRESLQVQRGQGGRRAAAPIGSEVFLQFLAMKCFEILKRLYVQQTVSDSKITELEFRSRLGEAEIECAPFIDQAFEIAATLKDNE